MFKRTLPITQGPGLVIGLIGGISTVTIIFFIIIGILLLPVLLSLFGVFNLLNTAKNPLIHPEINSIHGVWDLFFSGWGLFNIFASIFLILLGILFAPNRQKIARFLINLGFIGIMVFLLTREIMVIKAVGFSTKDNDSTLTSCDSGTKDLMSSITCLLVGKNPKIDAGVTGGRTLTKLGPYLAAYSFFLLQALAPCFILIVLFMDFVEGSGVISNPSYQKIIGSLLGIIAFRGFFALKLIYIFDIGAVGIGLVLVNFLFLGGLLSYVRKYVDKYKVSETASDLAKVNQINRQNAINVLNTISSGGLSSEQQAEFFRSVLPHIASIIGSATADALFAQFVAANPGDRRKIIENVKKSITG